MTTFRIDLSYHGGEFAGWAVQPSRRTVEKELTDALQTVFGGPLALTVAGRTDAGVHALGQVASFEAQPLPVRTDLRRALNGLTAHDVAIHAAGPVADGFDARRDASSRTYCYRLEASGAPSPFERGLSLWWPYPLDTEALSACAEALEGTHDFTAFTPTQTRHTHFNRDVLRAEWVFPARGERAGARGVCEFWIEADAFLHGMVRALVGTMLEVAGERPRGVEDFRQLLQGAPRATAGDTARPQGLYLASVAYDRRASPPT